MLLAAGAAAAQGPPGVVPPPAPTVPIAPAATRWSLPAVPTPPAAPAPGQPVAPAQPVVTPPAAPVPAPPQQGAIRQVQGLSLPPAAPPPPLPSASAQPYRPLAAADAPAASRRPAAPAPTRPVLTLQKPAGGDDPKAVPMSDPKLPPPAKGPQDEKTDRDPPRAVKAPDGQTSKEDLFRFDNETDVLRRITNDLLAAEVERLRKNPPENPADRRPPDPAYFAPPTVDPLVDAGTKYQAKTDSYPPAQAVLEPGYVVHRRLYFEDLNSERYGWEVGIAQPAVSTLLFWKDAVLYPAKLASHLGEWYDTSAGKCLPGSPVPYKVYPEPVDAFGILVGTGVIVGSVAALGGF